MASEVVMPKMGYDMTEGTILSWSKQEGDSVAEGDVLGEIETGKVNIEIEAFDAGVLRKILVGEGETVDVGVAIAIIAGADEEIEIPDAGANGARQAAAGDERSAEDSRSGDEADAQAPAAASPVAATSRASDSAEARAEGEEGRFRASPLARRMAEEEGIELASISGSGPHGRIVRDDVLAAIERGDAAPAAMPAAAAKAAPAAPAQPVRLFEGDAREDMSSMRKTIARRLTESWNQAPHIFLTLPIRMDETLALRKRINASLAESDGGKVSVNDFVIKAAALALRAHPKMNASWDDGARVLRAAVNVGVAIALDDGLITLAVADADRARLSEIAAAVQGMAERARSGKLHPEDLSVPSTFTVSNLGGYGIEHFTAIINPPEAAILAVGRATPQPVVEDGEIVVRNLMRVTLSADHRVVDGATAAEFLASLRDLLENPMRMLA